MFGAQSQQWYGGGYFAGLVVCLLLLTGCTVATPAPPAAEDETQSQTIRTGAAEGNTLLLPDSPPFETSNWRTDFSRRTVEWDEILSGGPPKDGIPSIDDPRFESIADAADSVAAREPVIVFEHNGDVRAYPLSILIWHEIVNDEVGGMPVAVTFCPLCNASIVFDRTFDGQVLDFGTTGRLRNSDLIMYDRQTETWWQQFTGQGIVGDYAGEQLTFLSSQVISFGDFASRYSEGQVLARPDAARSYGSNPYTGYDSESTPFLYDGELDERLPAMERVVGIDLDSIDLDGTVKAYAFSDVAEAGAINDVVADVPVVIFHKAGTASALDARSIAESRDVGSVGVFSRQVNERLLTFEAGETGMFTDAETGSTWTLTGLAVAGDLAGTQLAPVLSFDHFWFAWAAFHPETELFGQ